MTPQIHPGLHIRDNVLPKKMAVKEGARLLGVGRPAPSNLLNGNADLSPEMAARLEKMFGASQKELLEMQAAFDQCSADPKAPDRRLRPALLFGVNYFFPSCCLI